MSVWDFINPVTVLNPFNRNAPINQGLNALGIHDQPWDGQKGPSSSDNFDPYSGQPTRPPYQNYLGADHQLPSNLSVSPDTAGYDAFKSRALSTSPSPWANLELQQNEGDRLQGQGDATAKTASAEAGALSTLGSSGGYTGGARERVARDAGRTGMAAGQAVNQQANQAGLGVTASDAKERDSMLGALPGMSLNQLQPQEYNIGNTIGGYNAENVSNLAAYHDQMSAWGAGKQADATANAGK